MRRKCGAATVEPAGGDETFAIVDGQQGVRSVLQFIGSETDKPN